MEQQLDLCSSDVGHLWSTGKARFERLCGDRAAGGFSHAHATLTREVTVLRSRLAAAERRVAEARLPPEVASRVEAALRHVATLRDRLSAIADAVGPAPLPDIVESGEDGFRIRRIPADNSCLFHCISGIFHGGTAAAASLRRRCVEHVAQHAAELAQTLGDEYVAAYGREMMNPSAWGGGVEVDVFSKLYRCELSVFDVTNHTVDVFGRGRGYCRRAYLLFQGMNHYDLLGWFAPRGGVRVGAASGSSSSGGSSHQHWRYVFSTRDENCERRARRAAAKLGGGGSQQAPPPPKPAAAAEAGLLPQPPCMWRVDGELTNVAMLRQTSWE